MSFAPSRSNSNGAVGRRQPTGKRRHRTFNRRRLALEALESRRLLAVDCDARPDHPKCGGSGGDGGAGGDGGITNPAWVAIESGDVQLRSSDGLQSEKLASGGKEQFFAPSWSPDGTKIAFYQEVRQGRQILSWTDLWVMNSDGSNQELVYQFDSPVNQPVPHRSFRTFWIPGASAAGGGSKLLYSSNTPRDACILDLEKAANGDPQPFQCLGLEDALGLEQGSANIRAVSLGPSTPDGGFYISFVGFNPTSGSDDISLAKVSVDASGVYAVNASDIETMNMPGPQGLPVWSPDGSSIAFVDDASFDGGDQLKLVEIDTASPVPQFTTDIRTLYVGSSGLGHIAGQPTWSPSGQWIAFSATSGQSGGGWNWDVHMVHRNADVNDPANPHDVINVTNDSIDERQPSWNPLWSDDIGLNLQSESVATAAILDSAQTAEIQENTILINEPAQPISAEEGLSGQTKINTSKMDAAGSGPHQVAADQAFSEPDDADESGDSLSPELLDDGLLNLLTIE